MVVRILCLRIQWIVYISMCPWLLTHVSTHFEQFECGEHEKMTNLQCGGKGRPPKCNTVKCVQTDAKEITRVRVWSQLCQGGKNPSYGFSHNYIWTMDCCLIWARICYQVDPEEDQTNGNETRHEQASTMTTPEDIFNSTGIVDMVEQAIPTEIEADEHTETKSVMTSTMKTTIFEKMFTTPVDIFHRTEKVDMVEPTVHPVSEMKANKYTETNSAMTSTMKTTKLEKMFTTPVDIFNRTGKVDMVEPTVHTVLEMKANKYTETNSAMIGLYAGLPVGLFLFVAVLAVVCYIFRDKLKTMAGKFRKRHREGLYQESGTTSKPSTGNDISRTFANQEYAMHGDKENRMSESTPMGEYDFFKSWSEPEQNGSFHHNPIETEANSSCSKYRPGYEEVGIGESCNTYDTIGEAADRGRFDPNYNHIHGSNVSATDMRQGNKGGTEYDNADI